MNLIFYYLCSYFIGNLLTAHILVKFLHKGEILQEGSGNPGARNAGRLYGKKAFVLTFLGDALKSALVVLIGRKLGFSELEVFIAMSLVVIGHIKPILFKFKGGKGVSSYIGGIITFEPLMVLVIILGFLLTYPFTKSFTISGLTSFCLIPFVIFFLHDSTYLIWSSIALTLILILAHSSSFSEKWKKK